MCSPALAPTLLLGGLAGGGSTSRQLTALSVGGIVGGAAYNQLHNVNRAVKDQTNAIQESIDAQNAEINKPQQIAQITPDPPSPSIIAPTATSAASAEQARIARLRNLRYGYASTIRTTNQGTLGSSPELTAAQLYGRNTLGG